MGTTPLDWIINTLLLVLAVYGTVELYHDIRYGRSLWIWRRRFKSGDLVMLSEDNSWVWQIVASNSEGVTIETIETVATSWSPLIKPAGPPKKQRRNYRWQAFRAEGAWHVPEAGLMEQTL